MLNDIYQFVVDNRLHPVIIHFPIALLLTGTFLRLLYSLSGKGSALLASRWCIILGLLGAIAAVITGDITAGLVPHDDNVHSIMSQHERLAYWALGIFAFAYVFDIICDKLKINGSIITMIAMVVASITLGYVGHLGGEMVYEHGVGVAISDKTGTSSNHSHDHGGNDSQHGHSHGTKNGSHSH